MTIARGGRLLHYQLLEKIGEGGMGTVWKALDTRLDRMVALKLPSAELSADQRFLDRFEREAKAVAALSHPNIVTIHAVERDGDQRFFAMELLEGRRLGELIPPDGLPLSRFLELAEPLADAVAAAHARGITHRDLKPSNVMVSREGRLKVLDFGLARLEARRSAATAVHPGPPAAPPAATVLDGWVDETTRVADTTGLEGTLPYMAPEQVTGAEPADERSDLYSLGVILFEMATGRRPFVAADPRAAVRAMLEQPAPLASDPRPDFPLVLARLIRQCLERDRDRRPASAAAVRDEIRDARMMHEGRMPVAVRSLAILPFRDLSAGAGLAHLCDGLAEELINTMARVEGLRVTSRTSSFRFRDSRRTPREIGLELGVETLVEGAVQEHGAALRVTADLLEVAGGTCLWSACVERGRGDILAVHEEVARGLVEALGLEAGPRIRRALGRPRPADVEAYELYLRGRQFYNRFSRRNITFALELFMRAAERDPNFAAAHAGIADCYSYLSLHVDRSDENRRRAEEASCRALELDPDLAQAHVSRGIAYSLGGRHAEAEAEFAAAHRLDPWLYEAAYHAARDAFGQGKLELAARHFERAAALRPEDYQASLLVAQVYEALGRPSDAAAVRRRGLEAAERHLVINPDDLRALYMAANAMVALGERDRGLRWADRALALDPDDSMLLYNLACIRSLAGEREAALDLLERAVRAGLIHRQWIENDGDLAPLRSHPRFQAILRGLGG